MSVTKQMFVDAIQTLENGDGEGTVYYEVGRLKDGRALCLVFGYEDGYDPDLCHQRMFGNTLYTLCCKLAINIDDLQCDYDIDWYMPWSENGDVYDTNGAVVDDLDVLVDSYNDEAKTIIQGMDNGTLKLE